MDSKNQLEFEYPVDFQDEEVQESAPELPPFKASSILYSATVVYLFFGMIIPLIEITQRWGVDKSNNIDTFIELLEWNPFSQIGIILFLHGLVFFWLGLMTDRRGA